MPTNILKLVSAPVHFGLSLNPTQIKRVAAAVKAANEAGLPGYKKLDRKFTRLAKQHPVRGASRAWWSNMFSHAK